jgi:hypothetical protein
MREIRELNAGATPPNLTVFLDADDSVCRKRMNIRSEDKELFETNLRKTRERYKNAIEYLRRCGDKIEVIDANDSIDAVLNQILDRLAIYGPSWLRLQPYLCSPPGTFSLRFNGDPELKIPEYAGEFGRLLDRGFSDQDGFLDLLTGVRQAIIAKIQKTPLDSLASLFLDQVIRSGYRYVRELPWADLVTFAFEFVSPLHVVQRGTVVLLDQAKGRDKLTKKVNRIVFDGDEEIRKLSDFMLVFDPSASQPINGYYERGVVPLRRRDSDLADATLTPSTRLFGRADIAKWVLAAALKQGLKEHYQVIGSMPELLEVLLGFVEDSDVEFSMQDRP